MSTKLVTVAAIVAGLILGGTAVTRAAPLAPTPLAAQSNAADANLTLVHGYRHRCGPYRCGWRSYHRAYPVRRYHAPPPYYRRPCVVRIVRYTPRGTVIRIVDRCAPYYRYW